MFVVELCESVCFELSFFELSVLELVAELPIPLPELSPPELVSSFLSSPLGGFSVLGGSSPFISQTSFLRDVALVVSKEESGLLLSKAHSLGTLFHASYKDLTSSRLSI